ncbi:MAG: type II secretion system protein [Phycisphaerales bacterium]
MHRHTANPTATRRRNGFTIVELLVVIAIIVSLLAILIVALGAAARRATAANTQFLLGSISQGLVQFRNDIGYLPPILGQPGNSGANGLCANWSASTGIGLGRDFIPPPAWLLTVAGPPTQGSIDALQNWVSYTSLAEYLLGYGDRFADGYGAIGTAAAGTAGAKEVPLLGLRTPGADGAWGAVNSPRNNQSGANGRFTWRNSTGLAAGDVGGNTAPITGKVFGPYLTLKDDSLLGGLSGFDANGDPKIIRPGEAGYSDSMPKVILDYWGQPIHYYRRPLTVAGSTSGNVWTAINSVDPRTFEVDPLSTNTVSIWRDLGDIIALRPAEVRPGEDVPGVVDANGDSTTLMRLKSANFALMSRGPDKSWDKARRRGPDDLNKDNIVETGQ